MAAFVGNLTLDGGQGNDGMMQALEEQMERGRALLKRKMDGRKLLWRPKKRHRTASYKLSCTVHNQMSSFLPRGVLSFAVPRKPQSVGLGRSDP